jgi:pimeloyl-ACP methyl ester carboxylesterase
MVDSRNRLRESVLRTGNAENHVTARDYALRLSAATETTVYVADYQGYYVHRRAQNGGDSTSGDFQVRDERLPSEGEVYKSTVDAFKHLANTLHDVPIYIYGYSMGTAMAIQCALTDEAVARKCPLVLVAPLLSAFDTQLRKTVSNVASRGIFSTLCSTVDMFATEKYAAKIRVPALIFHGTADDAVPFAHGKRLEEIIGKGILREFVGEHHDTIREVMLTSPLHNDELRVFVRRGFVREVKPTTIS